MGTKPIKPIITEIEGKPYVRSTNFAKVFEREHKSVLDSIRNRQISASFLPISYQDSRKREQQEFLISEEGFQLLTQNYKTEEQQRHIKRYQILFNQANKQELDIIKWKAMSIISDRVVAPPATALAAARERRRKQYQQG